MMRRSPHPMLSLLLLTAVLAGCAGGWRNGAPPGTGASMAPAASGKATATGVAAPVAATVAASDGARFVYKGDGGSVAVAGEFNAWNTSADPLAKQADGSWLLVKKLQPGKYAYKFVIDGGTWKADESAQETADDGFGGKNSVVVVGGGGVAAPAAAAAATVEPAKAPATAGSATGDGARFVYKGAGNSVAVAGEFNAWNTSADPLAKQADGSWLLVKKLDPGKYAYKFVIDGGTWKADESAKEMADDGFGGKNSVIVVNAGGGGVAGAAATSPATAPAPSTATAAVTGKGAAPVATADGMRFTFAGAGNQVNLAGDFNNWSTTSDPMVRQPDGTWTLVRKIPAGSYGYKFLVDGKTWKQDDANPEAKDDGFGGKNSIITVP